MDKMKLINEIKKIDSASLEKCLTQEEKLGYNEGFNECKETVIKIIEEIF